MKSFTIRLAGQYFTICPVCDYIREYCRDYIVADVKRGAVTESPVYFTIATTQSDIDFEREKSAREDIRRHLRSIARLQTTSYPAIPCFFMARLLL